MRLRMALFLAAFCRDPKARLHVTFDREYVDRIIDQAIHRHMDELTKAIARVGADDVRSVPRPTL